MTIFHGFTAEIREKHFQILCMLFVSMNLIRIHFLHICAFEILASQLIRESIMVSNIISMYKQFFMLI